MNTFKSCVPCVCTSSGCKRVCEEYNITLGLLDNTLQRKLAHIQRLILLNYYLISITDITVSTLFLAMCDSSVLLVSNLFYFIFIFFQTHLLAYNSEKYLHLVLTPRSTTTQLTHGRKQQFWHIEPHCNGCLV